MASVQTPGQSTTTTKENMKKNISLATSSQQIYGKDQTLRLNEIAMKSFSKICRLDFILNHMSRRLNRNPYWRIVIINYVCTSMYADYFKNLSYIAVV